MWTSGTPRPEGSEVKEHDPNHRPLGMKMKESGSNQWNQRHYI